MTDKTLGLSKTELAILKKLNTPKKIQDWLDEMPINWEKKGETYMSPRRALRENKAHCFEGAMLAGIALWLTGKPPLVIDLKTTIGDDHIITLYKAGGYWGAFSKTNHAFLRHRDPIYKTIRELALSFFHEYFDFDNGKKILLSYSEPFSLKKLGTEWITAERELDDIAERLDNLPHKRLFPKSSEKFLRRACATELQAVNIVEWGKDNPRT